MNPCSESRGCRRRDSRSALFRSRAPRSSRRIASSGPSTCSTSGSFRAAWASFNGPTGSGLLRTSELRTASRSASIAHFAVYPARHAKRPPVEAFLAWVHSEASRGEVWVTGW